MLLPGRLLLLSRNYVRRILVRDGLSAPEIGRRLDVSHSAALEAIRVVGLNGSSHPNGVKKLTGQIPFGYVIVDC